MVMDWTEMGAPSPILTDPTCTGLVFFRVIRIERAVPLQEDGLGGDVSQ